MQARVHAPEAVAQAVHTTQAFLEGHGPLHRGAHHVQTCIPVLAVLGGALDVGPTARQAIQRNAIGGRVERSGHEGFHAVGDGVHAGGGGQARGQPEGEGGVEQGRFGHQVPAVKAEFATIVHDHDRAAGHFTAGASCGRHRDQRGDAFADARRAAFDGGVIFQGPGVGGGNRHAFGAVDGRTTAKSHQAIASVLLVERSGGAHRRFGRVGRGLVKHHRVGPQDLQGHVEQACGFDTGIGDDQGLADVGFVALGFELLQGAIGNLDVGEVDDLGHGG